MRDARCGVAFGDGSQGFAQVSVWVDGVQFAGFDQ
jgi:hypothetical protein